MIQTFNGDEVLECIKELIRLDKDWVPAEAGYSLYVRPTLSESLGYSPGYPKLANTSTHPSRHAGCYWCRPAYRRDALRYCLSCGPILPTRI